MQRKKLNSNKIILVSNIIILILASYTFISLHNLSNELNNEISYRNYLNSDYNIDFIDGEVILIETESIKFNKLILLSLIIILILILNNWYYVNKQLF